MRGARLIAVPVLIALACAFLLLGALQLYASQAIFDSEDFSDRATSALREEPVRAAVADRLTDEVLKASPDTVAVRPVIEAAASGVVGSAPFQSLLRPVLRDLHASIFSPDSTTVALTLADSGVLLVDALRQIQPKLAKDIPSDLEPTLLDISTGQGAGGAFADLAQTAEANSSAAPVNLAIALVLFAIAVGLAPQRRRAVIWVALAIAAVGVLIVVGFYVGRAIVGGQAGTDADAAALRTIWAAFLLDLRTWGLVLAGSGVVLAAAAASLIRPLDVAAPMRRAWDTVAATPATPGRRAIRAVALVAAGILIVVARDTVLELAVVAVGLLVLYLGVAEILRLSLPAVEPGPAAPRERRPGLAPSVYVTLIAVLVIGGGAGLAILLAGGGGPGTGPIRACNGHRELCDRPLDQVAFASSHNSMSAASEPGWLFPTHEDGIVEQLDGGIRGLLIDSHYGVKTPKGVATDLEAGSKSRAKIEDELGKEFVTTAERLRSRLGYTGGGDPKVYLCHGYCELGATEAKKALEGVREWLVANPHEVLVMSVEDDVSPEDTAAAFEESGLLDYVYTGPVGPPWPTLREMIESGGRLLVMAENETGDVPWYHPQFELAQETPYLFDSPEALERRASCEPNRGAATNSLFLLNNWVEGRPAPKPSIAARVNAIAELGPRAERCREIRDRLPNLVAVDFYGSGDVRAVVDQLNGVQEPAG